jgi:hypothetical protein
MQPRQPSNRQDRILYFLFKAGLKKMAKMYKKAQTVRITIPTYFGDHNHHFDVQTAMKIAKNQSAQMNT